MNLNKTGQNPSPDRDDMELKMKLNTSFEMDKLTVSEDLIQRTLLKIKETESTGDKPLNEQSLAKGKEISAKRAGNHYPVRKFASAAAAVLLVLTALWIYKNGVTGDKMDSGNIADGNIANGEMNYSTKATQDFGTAAAGTADTSDKEQSRQDKMAIADTADAASGGDNTDESGQLFSTAEEVPEAASNEVTLTAQNNTLPVLYTISKEEVQSFTLQVKDSMAQKTDIGRIEEFNTLLGGYTVQISDIQTAGDVAYSFVITTAENKSITFEFYQDNTVLVTDGRKDNQAATYRIDNGEELIEKLKNFTEE